MRKGAFKRLFRLKPDKQWINVRCKVKGYFTGRPMKEYDFERIASTAGVRTHGDFRVKEPRPYSSMLVGMSPKPSIFTKGQIAYGK